MLFVCRVCVICVYAVELCMCRTIPEWRKSIVGGRKKEKLKVSRVEDERICHG